MRSRPVSVLVSTLALASASALAQEDRHAHATEAAATRSSELFTADDLRFLQHMIVHHEQAVVMAALVPSRSDRPTFLRFADYVGRAQAAEIEVMQSLLDFAADRRLALPAHELHGDPPMDGMLSSAQIDALAAASSVEFERLWLEGMIFHHQGAIDMAQAQQRHQLASGRRPFGLSVLVEAILEEQRAEIARMRAWLDEWVRTGAHD